MGGDAGLVWPHHTWSGGSMTHLDEAAHVRFGNRHKNSLTGHLKVKPGLARRAFPPLGMSLKDRLTFGLNAVGAQIVNWLMWISLLMKAIYDGTGWGLPKLIAFKVGYKSLVLSQFILQRRQLEYEIRIRDLRICYLHSEFAKRRFEIGIASHLRSLEKQFNGVHTFGDFSGGIACGCGDLERATNALEVEFHNFLQLKAQLSDKIDALKHTADES